MKKGERISFVVFLFILLIASFVVFSGDGMPNAGTVFIFKGFGE